MRRWRTGVVVAGAMNVDDSHDLAHPPPVFADLAVFVTANCDRATMQFSFGLTALFDSLVIEGALRPHDCLPAGAGGRE